MQTLQKPFGVRDYEDKGRGLYALGNILQGELIESAPVIVLSHEERLRVTRTKLKHYYFYWQGGPHGSWGAAIALGHISLCNHSRSPNARFQTSIADERIDLIAQCDITAGDEITIDYDCELWFDVKD